MKIKFYIAVIILLLIISCENPSFNNPYDNTILSLMDGDLSITQISDSQVELHCSINEDVIGGYILERSVNDSGYYTLASKPSNLSHYFDNQLKINTLYSYRLYGQNDENKTTLNTIAHCPDSSGYGLFVYGNYLFLATANNGLKIYQYQS